MTVILPLGRALTRRFLPRSNQLLTRLASTNSLSRASQSTSGDSDGSKGVGATKKSFTLSTIRTYATEATAKPVGRPKAHTGRTAAKRSKSSSSTKSTEEGVKAKAKPKLAAKAKAKAKPKAKPKPKKRTVKKAPSASALNKARVARNKDLRAKALLSEPKQLPSNAWNLYFASNRAGVKSLAEAAERTKELAQKFKQLEPEELEKLNHTANQNKAKNEAEYKKWVQQYTPDEIRQANNARRTLSKEKKVMEGKKKASVHSIKDDRLVKRPTTAYIQFHQERFATGDFKHMAVAEASRLIGREWKDLSASQKKPYEDAAQADRNRYLEEVRTVYGELSATT